MTPEELEQVRQLMRETRRLMQQIRAIRWYAHIGINTMLGGVAMTLAIAAALDGVTDSRFPVYVTLYFLVVVIELAHVGAMIDVFDRLPLRRPRRHRPR